MNDFTWFIISCIIGVGIVAGLKSIYLEIKEIFMVALIKRKIRKGEIVIVFDDELDE